MATPAVNHDVLSKPSGGELMLKNKKTIIPSINPNNIRVYGTWNSKHTETGKETFSKWYAIINFNSAGKIVRFNDWFNVDGLEKQIAE